MTNNKNKTVLITGGAGFIGTSLSIKLKSEGFNVIVLDNLSKQVHGKNPELDSPLYNEVLQYSTFVNGSVTDRTILEEIIPQVHIIVHLAAETGTGQSMYEIERYVHVNSYGTSLLLDVLANREHTVERVVIASSRAIYGEGKYISEKYGVVYPDRRIEDNLSMRKFDVGYKDDFDLKTLPTDEDSKVHPVSVYGITKQAQELLVMNTCGHLGISAVAFRYQNVYGPGQSLKNPYTGILSIFSGLILDNKTVNIFEDGEESRDFVYIDDVVDATYKGITMDEAVGNIYNVGSGVPTTVKNVIDSLYALYEKQPKVNISGNYRVGDIRHNYADITSISADLGFVPKVPFEEGLKRFTDWVKEQQTDSSGYDASLEEMKVKGLFK